MTGQQGGAEAELVCSGRQVSGISKSHKGKANTTSADYNLFMKLLF